MKNRKQLEKDEARARRDHLMEKAELAQLPLLDGLREMRKISGLTQAQFAEHRGVSARVIKTLELGQGNPTVSTLNRIAAFYGLEVGFVPSKNLLIENVAGADILNDDDKKNPIQSPLVKINELQAILADHHARIAEMFSQISLDHSISEATKSLKIWTKDIKSVNLPSTEGITENLSKTSTKKKLNK